MTDRIVADFQRRHGYSVQDYVNEVLSQEPEALYDDEDPGPQTAYDADLEDPDWGDEPDYYERA